MLYAVPLWVLGYYGAGTMLSLYESLVGSTLLISTAVVFVLGVPIDGPAWTVCTLMVFWAFFPQSAKKAKEMTTQELMSWVVGSYYLQLLFNAAVFVPLFLTAGYDTAFAMATMVPWCRYPCFLMGVYAGELCLRHADEEGDAMPWPRGFFFFFPLTCKIHPANGAPGVVQSVRWAFLANVYSIFALVFTVLVAVANGIGLQNGIASILGGLWLQAIMPFVQLTVVVALTKDKASSLASRFLRHPTLMWLGKVSMAIYLVHHPTIYYVVWFHNCYTRGVCGPVDVPTADDGNDHVINAYLRDLTLPFWAVPIVVLISIPLAALLYYFVEEPGRKFLRSSSPSKPKLGASSGTAEDIGTDGAQYSPFVGDIGSEA
jgi:peptidoglycan/LPS O-acetylase OafA/YrhL